MTKVGTHFDINKSTTTSHIKFKRLPSDNPYSKALRKNS